MYMANKFNNDLVWLIHSAFTHSDAIRDACVGHVGRHYAQTRHSSNLRVRPQINTSVFRYSTPDKHLTETLVLALLLLLTAWVDVNSALMH